MAEDSSIYDAPSFVVNTDDGTMFSCVPQETVGLAHVKRRYWSLMSQDGVLYVGPPYASVRSAGEVRRLVSVWWERRKARRDTGGDSRFG